MSQDVEPGEEGHDLERCHVEYNGRNQAEDDEQCRGPWVPPAQQVLQPLPLRRQVANDCLDPPSDTPQSVVPHPHNIRGAGGRERVKLLIELVGVGVVGAREAGVHVGRMPWPPSVVPHPDQEQVEKDCWQDQLRIHNEYQK